MGCDKETKIFLTIVSTMLFAIGILLMASNGTPSADVRQPTPFFPEDRWIEIHGSWNGSEMHTWIEPLNNISVDRFTKVLWINQSKDQVRIELGKGPVCREVSKVVLEGGGIPLWRLQKDCYGTGPIPQGGTLFIRFTEQGRYNYKIIYIGKESSQKGVITVF